MNGPFRARRNASKVSPGGKTGCSHQPVAATRNSLNQSLEGTRTMRRLLSGAAALAFAGTIAFAGLATAAEEPQGPEVMALPAVLVNEVSTMGPNGPLDEAIEIVNT